MIFPFLKTINAENSGQGKIDHLLQHVRFYDGDVVFLDEIDMGIVFVDDENSSNTELIRSELYQYFFHGKKVSLIDMGNIPFENSIEFSMENLALISEYFVKNKKPLIIVSSKKRAALAQFMGYEEVGELINVVNIDERIEMDDAQMMKDPTALYLKDLFEIEPNYLQKYIHLGYQSYFVQPRILKALHTMNFEAVRLGELRPNIRNIEPYIRDGNTLFFNMNSIKMADAPACLNQSPNGFTSEEACQIARFAGLSDHLTTYGIYGYEEELDHNGQTGALIAQMIWYFIEGYSNRIVESVLDSEEDFLKFIVQNEEFNTEISFWKSKKTDRWWMEISEDLRDKFGNMHFIPCDYRDYQSALNNELPDRWMNAYTGLF